MANRQFDQYDLTILKRSCTLFGVFSVGAAGAVTLQKWNYPVFGAGTGARTYTAAPTAAALGSGAAYPNQYNAGAEGIRSVTRTATGLWTIVLQDNYQRILGVRAHQSIAGGLANIVAVGENSTITNMSAANGSIIGIALLSSTATAADPTSGSSIVLALHLQDATEP